MSDNYTHTPIPTTPTHLCTQRFKMGDEDIATLIINLTTKVEENNTQQTLNTKLVGEKIEKLVKTEIEQSNVRITELEHEVKVLKQDKADRDRDARSLNIIIRGIDEKQDEKMHEVMTDLFKQMGASFPYSMTQGAFRMGKKQENIQPNKNTRYRPIKLKLLTRQQKSELFGLKSQHKGRPEIAAITFTNDMTSEEMLQNKVIQQIHSVAKDMRNTTSKMRGTSIAINGRLYNEKNFNELPHELQPEQVSTVETYTRVYFQGHSSPLSNFYSCRIVDGDRIGNCVEQLYAWRLCEAAQDADTLAKVKKETNPYAIKGLVREVKRPREWDEEREVKELSELEDLKFSQLQPLKDKLLSYKSSIYIECTRDHVHGAGISLRELDDKEPLPRQGYKNRFGNVLTQLRLKYEKAG